MILAVGSKMLPNSHCMLKAKNLSFIFLEEAFSNSCGMRFDDFWDVFKTMFHPFSTFLKKKTEVCNICLFSHIYNPTVVVAITIVKSICRREKTEQCWRTSVTLFLGPITGVTFLSLSAQLALLHESRRSLFRGQDLLE